MKMKSKTEIKKIVKLEENKIFSTYPKGKSLLIKKIICWIMKNNRFYRYRLLKSYRFFNYYQKLAGHYLAKLFWGRAYGKWSLKLGCQINCDNIGKGFYIEHPQIVINKQSIIGENVICLGNNCIGGGPSGAPKIGNGVILGYGAIVIGGIEIADNVQIGAGAIVTKTISKPDTKVVGINRVID